jgi:hypothetical protein
LGPDETWEGRQTSGRLEGGRRAAADGSFRRRRHACRPAGRPEECGRSAAGTARHGAGLQRASRPHGRELATSSTMTGQSVLSPGPSVGRPRGTSRSRGSTTTAKSPDGSRHQRRREHRLWSTCHCATGPKAPELYFLAYDVRFIRKRVFGGRPGQTRRRKRVWARQVTPRSRTWPRIHASGWIIAGRRDRRPPHAGTAGPQPPLGSARRRTRPPRAYQAGFRTTATPRPAQAWRAFRTREQLQRRPAPSRFHVTRRETWSTGDLEDALRSS